MFLQDHVALTVKNLDVSREFYESLGGRVVSKPSSAFMEIVLGEIRLHILPTRGATDPSASDTALAAPRIDHLCMRVATVDDLTAMERRINEHRLRGTRARGECKVEDSPPLGEGGKTHAEERPPRKTLYFEDPDGIRLEIRAYA
jgi:catechol 2,3-dioxygenase-like lactoylglutathione lyase family enzyme